MSTTYILAGGYLHKSPQKGKEFCEAIAKSAGRGRLRILVCLFAQPREVWEEKFKGDTEFFLRTIPDCKLVLASPRDFIEQMKASDVVFLRGGDTDQLLSMLNASGDWTKELEGKVFAGTSAGAEVISRYYYGLDSLKITEGTGMLPIKVIMHWKSDYNAPHVDWDRAYAELKEHGEDLPVHPLKEGEFKVFES